MYEDAKPIDENIRCLFGNYNTSLHKHSIGKEQIDC
jgi:hypothetical protein